MNPLEDSQNAALPTRSNGATSELDISDTVENIFLEDSSQNFYNYFNSNILPEDCGGADVEMGLGVPWWMEDTGG